jgi:hypothetical protein
MGQTIESKNKALVLEAFDTLFNKRDRALSEFLGPLRPDQTKAQYRTSNPLRLKVS